MFLEVALFLLLLFLYYAIQDAKPRNMPPGPFEVPFLGNALVFDERKAEPLRKKFGNIVTVRTGNIRTVLLFDYKIAKDVMGRAEFAGRPKFFAEFSIDDKKTGGVVGSNGAQWQHDRRFTLRNLRNLGMGKSYLEGAINEEAQALIEDLKKYNGEAIQFPDSLRTVALNIIWQMVAGHRYDLRSKDVDSIYQATKEFRKSGILSFLDLFFPAMKKIPTCIKRLFFNPDVFKNFVADMVKLVTKAVTEHEERLDSEDRHDLIDEYLSEMKANAEHGEDLLMRRGALLQIINDLFGAGSDTVSTMLKWTIFLLARYPAVAEKLRKQIDEHVPRDRLVSLDDKPNLPYVDAFTIEALRFSSMIVMNVQRTALVDTTIEGYHIPKDTTVTVCNYSVHFDPAYWKNPEEFNPGRFIDEDGKFQPPKEGFFAFGSGRRQCLGELLARMEYFLFSAAIIQNFDIQVPEGEVLEDEFNDSIGIRIPRDKKFIYKPRL